MNLEELNEIYKDGEEVDKGVFAEMRSNLLLISGDHYAKKGMGDFFDRVRANRHISQDVKVRLTKNHIQKIHKIYVNNILSYAPGVSIGPKNESEAQDRKAAELNKSVWLDGKYRHDLDEKTLDWGDDFVGCGEVGVKLYYEPNAGQIKGRDEEGNVIYSGDVLFESFHPFNLLRSKNAKTLKESPVLVLRKMVSTNDLKKKFPDSADKIQDGEDKTFLVFDHANMGYRKAGKGETLLREYYFRPCAEYPMGYYVIATEEVKLAEGELPVLNGKPLFPIEVELLDRIQTEARGRSIIKQARPYQAEINRCGSKIAEHHMTLGDDKIITFHGSKISEGALSPGVRHFSVTGNPPTVMPGRSGNQYLDYMLATIDELYKVMMVDEDNVEINGQLDPYALLFKSARQKKMYKRYISRFENFLVRVCKLYLNMCKLYYSDEMMILASGKKEQINIPEFRQTQDIDFVIKLDKVSDDVETMMGKQLTMNHLLQYTGNNMDKQDIGKIIKNMPYANIDESFNDLTMNYEIAENLILALDRGEYPEMRPNDPHDYLATKVNHRMAMADYNYLHKFIKANYEKKLQELLGMAEEVRQKVVRDNSKLIPTTGTLIGVDFYVPDPENPNRTRRARVPYDAMKFLMDGLESQGTSLAGIEGMTPELQAQMPKPGQEGPIENV